MSVVRECLHDVGACMHELPVQLGHDLGMLENDLRNECAGLQVAAALTLEEVALRADHRPLLEALQKTLLRAGRHRDLLIGWSDATSTLAPLSNASSHAITTASVPAASAAVQNTIAGSFRLAASMNRRTPRSIGCSVAVTSTSRPRETPRSLNSGSSSKSSDDSLPST